MSAEIPNKISSALGKIEGNNRYYVLFFILAMVFLLDYFLLMSPQLASLRKINPEIKIVANDINKAKEDMKQLSAYQNNLDQLSQKFDQANLKVKSKDEIPLILEHIANVAGETGVKIDQITPDTLDQELLTENSQGKYLDLPIYIEARSGYHNFGRFLNKINEEGVPLRVGAFTILATNDSRFHLVKLTFRATVFEEASP